MDPHVNGYLILLLGIPNTMIPVKNEANIVSLCIPRSFKVSNKHHKMNI